VFHDPYDLVDTSFNFLRVHFIILVRARHSQLVAIKLNNLANYDQRRHSFVPEIALSDEAELQELHEVVPRQRPGCRILGGGALPADFESSSPTTAQDFGYEVSFGGTCR
jgi:hypothetical protein